MFSKLSISLAAALALSAAASGCRARKPNPDQYRRSPRARGGGHGSAAHRRHSGECPLPARTRLARRPANRCPLHPGAWVAPMLARDEAKGRAASVGTHRSPAKRSSWRQVLQLPIRRTGATDGSNARVAVLGTGRMGGAFAHRLKAGGFQVLVWDRTKSKAEALGVGTSPIRPLMPHRMRMSWSAW